MLKPCMKITCYSCAFMEIKTCCSNKTDVLCVVVSSEGFGIYKLRCIIIIYYCSFVVLFSSWFETK